jgi:hypothetical protein
MLTAEEFKLLERIVAGMNTGPYDIVFELKHERDTWFILPIFPCNNREDDG